MASITVSGNNISSFDAGTEHVNEAVIGTTYEGNYNHVVTCRYKFTTDGYGATSVSFKTANATATVRGSSSSEDSIGRMRFDITTSSTKYKTYKGNDYGTAITSYSYGNYVQGSMSIKLLPNTTYYLWIFPASNFSSYTRFSIGNCTVTTSGTYGTASTISASNGTFGSGISVTLSNSVSGTTNTLTVSCGGITKTLINNTTAMSATWTPSLTEYGAAITNAKSATATFTVTTKYGTATWGTSTKTITVSFPDTAGPSISAVSITYDNANTDASAFTVFVQGYSKAKATITAAGKYSATISTYELTINGATTTSSTSPVTSEAVTTAGEVTATVKVTDSRGFSASTTATFTVQQYSQPVLTNVSLYRSNSGGTASDSGTYLAAYAIGNISGLSSQNTMTMTVAFKTATGSYGTEAAMSSGTRKVVSGLNADVTYVARITLTDGLGNTAVATATIHTQKWAMKFNSTGTAVGFGKAPEASKVLEIPHDWEIARKTSDGTDTHHALFDNDELAASNIDGILPVNHGGTGASAAAAARTNLGIGNVGTLSAINGLFVVEEKTFINAARTIAAGASASGTLTVTKSGYTALGPIGFYVQSSSLVLVWNYMSATNTYRWAIGNPTNSSQSISVARAYILYVKNSV